MLEARGPIRSAICFRSILSRQNCLNHHMKQNIHFLSENQVFSVFLFFGPVGSLFWPYTILSQERGYSPLIHEFWQTDGGHQKFRFGLEAYSPSVLDWQTTIWRYFVMKLPSKNVKNHEHL